MRGGLRKRRKYSCFDTDSIELQRCQHNWRRRRGFLDFSGSRWLRENEDSESFPSGEAVVPGSQSCAPTANNYSPVTAPRNIFFAYHALPHFPRLLFAREPVFDGQFEGPPSSAVPSNGHPLRYRSTQRRTTRSLDSIPPVTETDDGRISPDGHGGSRPPSEKQCCRSECPTTVDCRCPGDAEVRELSDFGSRDSGCLCPLDIGDFEEPAGLRRPL